MYEHILDHLPNKSSFRFVDRILQLDENGAVGEYTLRKDAFFYEDHFVGNPVTPGVILTEIMAQIGLQTLGIFLILENSKKYDLKEEDNKLFPLLASTEIYFYKMVLPGEKVKVISKKEYFRFGKLKCAVQMLNENDEVIAKGILSGIIKSKQ
jgi:3-hydroxyacyl-[acyl-carrier-protein] dehydratase